MRRLLLRPLLTAIALTLLLTTGSAPALAEEDFGWPREIKRPEANIVIYQPQPEEAEGNLIKGRTAVSVTVPGDQAPVFGTVWFEAKIATDRDNRTADILSLDITRVRFPDATDDQQQRLASILEEQVEGRDLTISLDRLITSLDQADVRRKAAEGFNDTPPEIIVSNEPAVLVSIDGEPRMQTLEGSDLEYVVNTPFVILKQTSAKTVYLYAGNDTWYQAGSPLGPWRLASSVPKSIRAAAPKDEDLPEEMDSANQPTSSAPPKIIVATQPSELIVIDGQPEYTPLAGGELLYVSNTEEDLLVEVATQKHYVLLSGRWFTAPSLDGPWTFTRSDELPESFLQISTESEMAHLRTWVAGTDEAEDAILDAQVPQTSAIKRDSTTEVTYDGTPQFEAIEGTELAYAANTSKQVIQYKNKYYCVDEGVWYESSSATGPWAVATEVPDEIYNQPASSPTYNTTYVYVYDATPTTVYVGYYPGYTYSYPYYGALVYGTGWYYRPWYGRYYYPRASTWGFHVRYNPWYGWSFGLSYSTGRFTFGIGYGGWGGYHGGWWGPAGYRPYYRGYNRGWHHGYGAGYAAGRRAEHYNNNLYARPANRDRNTIQPRASTMQAPVAQGRANNVLADRDGNVHRKQQDGTWQTHQNGQWSKSDLQGAAADRAAQTGGTRERPAQGNAQPSTRQQPATRQPTGGNRSYSGSRGSTSSLDRQYQDRQRGTARTQSFNRSAGRGGARGGGAARGRGGTRGGGFRW
ncbi:MAG: carbohydrate-binding family V/XII [Acidobacteriota bacterium]